MKSSVIKLDSSRENLNEILDETQKITASVGLDVKKSLRVRLLAEELVGMLGELSGCYEGEFWIDQSDLAFELVTRIRLVQVMDKKTKKGFIDVASNKKNAAAKGIVGKLRNVVENMMYPEDAAYGTNSFGYGGGGGATLSAGWSLNKYKNAYMNDEDRWDEIEKSIIANVADDVTVGIKGSDVEIVIRKNFA